MTNATAELLSGGLASVREARDFLSASKPKVYEMMRSGELPYTYVGRQRRIPRKALIAAAAKRLSIGEEGNKTPAIL